MATPEVPPLFRAAPRSYLISSCWQLAAPETRCLRDALGIHCLIREVLKMSHRLAILTAAMIFTTAAIVVCKAQVEQGAIAGAVVDPSGASIPKAKVTATNQATQAVAVTETTDDGYYKI